MLEFYNVQPGTAAQLKNQSTKYIQMLNRNPSAGTDADSEQKDEIIFVAPTIANAMLAVVLLL